ncbi:type III PLP-dependent enzyme [Vibrio kasasachensis]|uniref:type III PLP-dependent enzyme n=1 Tax=Vibrio kasasachensis TaxID=2910248 RepID=UPI003D0B7915
MFKLPATVQKSILDTKSTYSDPVSMFIYDLPKLEAHIQYVMEHLPDNVELYYAIKANSEKEILDTLAPWVHGFEISSGGETQKIAQCEQALPFVFSGPGKLDSELESALIQGVEAIHIESLNEIARLQNIAHKLNLTQAVFIRINPTLPPELESKLTMAGRATPFGIDEAELKMAIDAVDSSENLTLKGFHVHAMSHQKSVKKHKTLIDFYLSRWADWRDLASSPDSVTHLNVGGGIGVNYLEDKQFDWLDFCGYLDEALSKFDEVPTLRFEPGRFISAFCGYYVMEVLDIKSSHGESFVICRGGTHQFRLPAAQNHDHPVIHLPLELDKPHNLSPEKSWSVVGQLCTPKDIFSRSAILTNVSIGDMLILPLAGAYGFNISHVDFLCHPHPVISYLPKASMYKERKFG